MSRTDNLYVLPDNLPVPQDDGACNHLTGLSLPTLSLYATDGTKVNLHALTGRTVVYIYPRTGTPGEPPPEGWDMIPGARGCTPQACSYRDHYQELQAYKVRVFGLSTQSTVYQQEAVTRLHLPFALLSDNALLFTDALELPTFNVAGMTLLKRVTLIINNSVIEKVFYPVFPPDKSAEIILQWLAQHPPTE